eukprot:31093-Pelagococcus_subviridis.AAC.9
MTEYQSSPSRLNAPPPNDLPIAFFVMNKHASAMRSCWRSVCAILFATRVTFCFVVRPDQSPSLAVATLTSPVSDADSAAAAAAATVSSLFIVSFDFPAPPTATSFRRFNSSSARAASSAASAAVSSAILAPSFNRATSARRPSASFASLTVTSLKLIFSPRDLQNRCTR